MILPLNVDFEATEEKWSSLTPVVLVPHDPIQSKGKLVIEFQKWKRGKKSPMVLSPRGKLQISYSSKEDLKEQLMELMKHGILVSKKGEKLDLRYAYLHGKIVDYEKRERLRELEKIYEDASDFLENPGGKKAKDAINRILEKYPPFMLYAAVDESERRRLDIMMMQEKFRREKREGRYETLDEEDKIVMRNRETGEIFAEIYLGFPPKQQREHFLATNQDN